MERHDREQAEMLKNYKDLRHYSVVYRGFFKTVAATMDVEVSYDAASGKSYRIIAQSGSVVLCEKVIRRALDSEKEASLNKGATALTPANYNFQLLGSESIGGHPAYILNVEPCDSEPISVPRDDLGGCRRLCRDEDGSAAGEKSFLLDFKNADSSCERRDRRILASCT